MPHNIFLHSGILHSRAIGKSISTLGLPEGAVLVAVVRNDDLIIPRGNVVLQPEDRIIALTKTEDREKLAAALA